MELDPELALKKVRKSEKKGSVLIDANLKVGLSEHTTP